MMKTIKQIKNERNYRNDNGINLIGLVITIVILLILAGVTILTVTNTGIVENSEKVKNDVDDKIGKLNNKLENLENEKPTDIPSEDDSSTDDTNTDDTNTDDTDTDDTNTEDNTITDSDTSTDTGCTHSYSWKTINAATCTTEGLKKYVCTVCGDINATETIAALGHNIVIDNIQATCTTSGQEGRYCNRCDYASYETIYAYGHNYEVYETVGYEWESLLNDGCKHKHIAYYKCSRCAKKTGRTEGHFPGSNYFFTIGSDKYFVCLCGEEVMYSQYSITYDQWFDTLDLDVYERAEWANSNLWNKKCTCDIDFDIEIGNTISSTRILDIFKTF